MCPGQGHQAAEDPDQGGVDLVEHVPHLQRLGGVLVIQDTAQALEMRDGSAALVEVLRRLCWPNTSIAGRPDSRRFDDDDELAGDDRLCGAGGCSAALGTMASLEGHFLGLHAGWHVARDYR